MNRRRSKLAAIALMIICTGYGPCSTGNTLLKSFRIALASSNPLINSLADSGVIPRTKATEIIRDFDAGAGCGLALQDSFNAIPSELPANEQRSRKFAAASTALSCFRTIINRQNFAAHPRVQQAASIAEGILASLVIFYSDSGADRAAAPAGTASHIVIATSEKDLEEGLKRKVKELEAALKVR